MSEPIGTYHEQLGELSNQLAERGSLGLIVLDASSLASIEYEYGTAAYDEVRERCFKLLREQRGKDYRNEDVLALDKPRGLRFILFLEHKRRRGMAFTSGDHALVRMRLVELARARTWPAPPFRIARCCRASRSATGSPSITLSSTRRGSSRRAFEDALETAAHERLSNRLQVREQLQDLLVRGKVITAYQPILRMKDRTVLGFEALSRGPRGTRTRVRRRALRSRRGARAARGAGPPVPRCARCSPRGVSRPTRESS